MNRLRRTIVAVGSLGIAGALSGCVTRSLFEPHRYVEVISSVLVSQDKKTLAVLTDDYHYIFDAPDTVVTTVLSSFHRLVVPKFSEFHVDSDGRISGELTLVLTPNAPEQDRTNAMLAGFKSSPNGGSVFNCKLSGTRYRANGVKPSDVSQRLNKEYRIHVRAEQATSAKAAKSLLTPITIAADGVLLIAGVALAGVFVGTMAVVCRPNCGVGRK